MSVSETENEGRGGVDARRFTSTLLDVACAHSRIRLVSKTHRHLLHAVLSIVGRLPPSTLITRASFYR